MSVRPLREWWNRVVPLRVKYLVITSVCVLILVGAFQYQTSRLASDRAADLKANQTTQCVSRVDSRNDLRDILFRIVDLSDLFDPATITPQGQAFVDNYKNNRIVYINDKYPALDGAHCSVDGIATPIATAAPTSTTETP